MYLNELSRCVGITTGKNSRSEKEIDRASEGWTDFRRFSSRRTLTATNRTVRSRPKLMS